MNYSVIDIQGSFYAAEFDDKFTKCFSEHTIAQEFIGNTDNNVEVDDGGFNTEIQYHLWKKDTRSTAKVMMTPTTSGNLTVRYVSSRTRNLLQTREKMKSNRNTDTEYDKIQKDIEESSLQDYKD